MAGQGGSPAGESPVATSAGQPAASRAYIGLSPLALGNLCGRDEDEDDEDRRRQRRRAERILPGLYRDWRYADLEQLKEALRGLLCTPRGESVLKGMPARRTGRKRLGEQNLPHQRKYLETSRRFWMGRSTTSTHHRQTKKWWTTSRG